MNKIHILILSIILFQCKQKTETVNELVDRGTINIQNNILTDTIFYNQNEKFVRLNDTLFKASNVEIIDKEGVLYLHLDSDIYDEINFNEINYEGPGYSFSLFSSQKAKSNKLILIEAQSDIGTAWYYFIFVESNKIVDSFILKEPRSNSELYSAEQFIKVYKTNYKYGLMFKEGLVAKYSKVPSDVLRHNGYYVIEKKITKKNEVQNLPKDTSSRQLTHVFYSNGGLLAFYNDGTVTGCPQCDLSKSNIELLKSKEPFATYTSDEKTVYVQYEDGSKSEMKFYVDGKISQDWAAKDGKWL